MDVHPTKNGINRYWPHNHIETVFFAFKTTFRSLDESGCLDRCSEWTLQASPCPVAYRIYRQTLAVPKVLFQMPRALRKCPFEHKRNIFFDIFIQILPDIWHIIYIYSRSFVWYLHISSRFFLSSNRVSSFMNSPTKLWTMGRMSNTLSSDWFCWENLDRKPWWLDH